MEVKIEQHKSLKTFEELKVGDLFITESGYNGSSKPDIFFKLSDGQYSNILKHTGTYLTYHHPLSNVYKVNIELIKLSVII